MESAFALQKSNLPFSAQQYALIFLDQNGQPVIDVSPSLVGYETAIFPPEAITNFLAFVGLYDGSQAYARMPITQAVISEPPSWSRTSYQAQARECYWNVRQASRWAQPAQESPFGLISYDSKKDIKYKRQNVQKRKFQSPSEGTSPSALRRRSMLRIDNSGMLKLFYLQAFENIQQIHCRTIAKVYVKLLEPRKMVKFPYNGKRNINGRREILDPESTKPSWWPECIHHREPDHLLKKGKQSSLQEKHEDFNMTADRLALLLHILCNLKESHGVTAARLRSCDGEIRRRIETDSSRLNTMNILGEIYSVREMEERYLGGEIGMDWNLEALFYR
ncbi:hypothetical protein N7494_005455 [Penicillium frequentans]|uniref:Subtelomeric hrmA-associated cluster protein AFUB-079030/YDR124W-like helical bundle domain-containing protein n=1 Tax=Penicillium frequentans TaxID=3151616 RepID=A0AAD6CXZ9_9EURO|nr:hypothetical protein N7494_005455 [Penicillium glabrum]